jgi:hypothetical protein
MKFRLGRYEITKDFRPPELVIEAGWFMLDIDFNPKFPYGWCAVLNIPRERPWAVHLHSAWHAWSGEANAIDLWLGSLAVSVCMPTWWRFRETGREIHERDGRRVTQVHGHYYRTWPYIPWPPAYVRRETR